MQAEADGIGQTRWHRFDPR